MAWTEICKIDFQKQVEHKKEQGISVRQALKQLSEESEIPIGTLTNWMYPERQKRYQESVVKNDNTNDIFNGLSSEEQTQIIQDAEKQMIRQAREIKESRTEQKRANNLKETEQLAAQYVEDDAIKIWHGDFYELCKDIPDESIDLVLTDPPYPKEFIHVWGQLGEVAARVLKPSGFLVSYSGQLHLPRVMTDLSNHLDYYWMSALQHTQRGTVMGRNMMCGWKPILIYQKPPFKRLDYMIKDFMDKGKMEKGLHEWQQDLATFEYLLQHFSKTNDLILEPFMGSGTTLVAAKKLKRRCIGIDIDIDCITTVKGRLSNEQESMAK